MGRVALALVAGVAAAAIWRRRRRTTVDAGPAPVLPTTSASRIARLAAASTAAAGTAAAARARRTFAAVDRDPQLIDRWEARSADQLVHALGDMKGALMKLGQMASFMDQCMPEHLRTSLAQLQHQAPSMAPELAAKVVIDELGAPPTTVFAEWDPLPFAAASIGQVHRALTHDGRAVAVKVQYPGVDQAIRSDLEAAGLLIPVLRGLFPGVDAVELIEEVRERVTEEVDYRREADNQTLFAEHWHGHPHVHIPTVDRALSTRRVLTSELVAADQEQEDVEESSQHRDLPEPE